MSFLHDDDDDEEEQGGNPPNNLSRLQYYLCSKFGQYYTNKVPHTKEKSTDLRKKSMKSGTLTVKYGPNQMHISDDNDASVSESVSSPEFEYVKITYSPGSN